MVLMYCKCVITVTALTYMAINHANTVFAINVVALVGMHIRVSTAKSSRSNIEKYP